ncbi:hypothetical protein [Hymenobacter cellulosilyticus]|uniref:Uncharacterized protein n=1 Tax=Hymenobacter cellulosilyticus TaxID=2932248 RepID=A0A8T9Q706_9BACT|nr:hypothetical protein [Hymenobacter cellulosilyticus]UOQ70813.1 hypothetical protein MUN79_19265 [Hymenobacter cellulosilyticus]
MSAYYQKHGQFQELKYFEQMRAALSAQSANADEAVAKLTEIERAVESDKSLEPESQIALLQGLSVGKHSAQYWYAQVQLGGKSPWIIKNTTATGGTTTAAKINWWKVGLSDLVGGLAGAGGGPTGVIIGGLGASLQSVIDQLP